MPSLMVTTSAQQRSDQKINVPRSSCASRTHFTRTNLQFSNVSPLHMGKSKKNQL